MRDELYSAIYAALMGKLSLDTPEEQLFIHEVALTATDGVMDHVRELEEAMEHLQATIRRLSHGE